MQKYIFIFLIIVSYLGLNYIPTLSLFASSISTCLILLFSFLVWKNNFLNKLGLNFQKKDFGFFCLISLGIMILSFFIFKWLLKEDEIKILFLYPMSFYHDFFYTLNEEIVIGALLLFNLQEKLKTKPLFTSIMVAGIFSLLHFIFYNYFVEEQNQIYITTLIALFLVGVIRNNLIFIFNNIIYSWAFHFGASSIIFGPCFYFYKINQCLLETEILNKTLGNYIFITILLSLSFLTAIKLKSLKN